jgi:serine/threonine protein kinase
VSVPVVSGGRYRLERPLGRGGMATVYLACDTELDRPVAVKVLAESLAGDAAFRSRLLREARLAARLSHPNVVSIYDVRESEDRKPYIVMELVDGPTLAELLRERGRLPPDEAVGLAVQACRGLAHAHAAGLVHRDVKPQNLLLREDGMLKVADFGIARAAESTALTQAAEVPRRVEDAVMRSLARNPDYRPRSAEALAQELAPESPEPPTVPMAAPRKPRSRVWLALAAVLIAAVAVALAVSLATRDNGSPPPRPAPARAAPIAHQADAQQQARTIAAWLRRYSR